MAAGAATLFFHLGKVGALVPVGLGVVVIGHSIKTRSFGGATGDDGIRHEDNGRGIHAAAELGEYGTVRTESAADSFSEDEVEVLFVFTIRAVPDLLVGIKIPVSSDRALP